MRSAKLVREYSGERWLRNWLTWEWTRWLKLATQKRYASNWEWAWCLTLAMYADNRIEGLL